MLCSVLGSFFDRVLAIKSVFDFWERFFSPAIPLVLKQNFSDEGREEKKVPLQCGKR